jgi:hypothetical protein
MLRYLSAWCPAGMPLESPLSSGSWSGCLANIVGLPLCHVYFALRRMGVATGERPEVVCQSRFAFRCEVWRAVHRRSHVLRDAAEYRTWSEEVD